MIRRLLGIDDLEDSIDDIEERLEQFADRQEAIEAELEDIATSYVGESELDSRLEDVQAELKDMVEQVESSQGSSEASDLSPTERQIVGFFLRRDGWYSVKDVAAELDKSPGSIRKYLSMLRDRIEFEEKRDGRKKVYKLSSNAQSDILEGSTVQHPERS